MKAVFDKDSNWGDELGVCEVFSLSDLLDLMKKYGDPLHISMASDQQRKSFPGVEIAIVVCDSYP